MSQSVPKKFKTPLSLSLSLSSPLLQFLSKLLSFSHPSLKLVSRQNRSPLASAEEIGFLPRWKSPKPDGSFFSCSLTLSLTSPAHSIVTSLISPILRAHLRMPAPLCPYLRCIARFQSPSQPPAASMTTSLKEFTDKVF
jgi:hypothetical protein